LPASILFKSLAGLKGPPRSKLSIVLNTLAAFEGSEPVYACIEINWIVLNRPKAVAADTPDTALVATVITPTPVALLTVYCAYSVGFML
jgi:hypothetical protein